MGTNNNFVDILKNPNFLIFLNIFLILLFVFHSNYNFFLKLLFLGISGFVLFYTNVSIKIDNFFKTMFKKLLSHPKRKYIYFLFMLFILSLFFLFRLESYGGDYKIFISMLGARINHVPYFFNFYFNFLILDFLQVFVGLSSTQAILWSYYILNSIVGIVFIIFAKLISDEFFSDYKKYYLFFFILLSTGAKVFFGDVEQYSIPVLFLLIFILFSIRYLKKKNNLLPVVITYVVALFMHPHFAIFLPALILIVFLRKDNLKKDLMTIFLSLLFFVILTFVIQKNIHVIGESLNVVIPDHVCINCLCGDINCGYPPDDFVSDFDYKSIILSIKYLLLLGPLLFLSVFFLIKKSDNNTIKFLKAIFVLLFLRIIFSKYTNNPDIFGDWSFALMFSSIINVFAGVYLLKEKKTSLLVGSILVLLLFYFVFWFNF